MPYLSTIFPIFFIEYFMSIQTTIANGILFFTGKSRSRKDIAENMPPHTFCKGVESCYLLVEYFTRVRGITSICCKSCDRS